MKLINYTPHEINIGDGKGNFFTVPKGDSVIRVSSKKEQIGELEGFPVFSQPILSHLKREELPGMEDWDNLTYGIVSMVVKQAIAKQFPEIAHKFLSPGELIRDEKGQPIGCLGLNS